MNEIETTIIYCISITCFVYCPCWHGFWFIINRNL